jgi:exopolyphosphatase
MINLVQKWDTPSIISQGDDETLLEYLQKVKSKYKRPSQKEKHFVMGNEAGDMDSVVSAIVFAYANRKNAKQDYFPVINIPEQELYLRQDVVYVLSQLGAQIERGDRNLLRLKNSPLLFRSHLEEVNHSKWTLTLVDHTRLSPKQEQYASRVARIIDHHDEKETPGCCVSSANKVQQKMGSNATLIAKEIKKIDQGKYAISANEARLLLSAILLDTDNCKNKKKTEPEDEEEVYLLAEIIASKGFCKNALAEHLIKLKNNVKAFTLQEMLKRDYKEYREGEVNHLKYGIVSIPSSWDAIDNIEDKNSNNRWNSAYSSFKIRCQEIDEQSTDKTRLHFLSALAHYKDERCLIVYFPDEHLSFGEKLLKMIEEEGSIFSSNGIPESPKKAMGELFCYELKGKPSRKDLQPKLTAFFEKYHKELIS